MEDDYKKVFFVFPIFGGGRFTEIPTRTYV